MTTADKSRYRVKTRVVPIRAQRRAAAQWLRDTGTGVLAARRAALVDNRDDITRVWDRVSAIALDLIQNSGRLKGVVDQVLADTVGTELKLNARPDLSKLGYSEQDAREWARLVEQRWRRWAWEPSECDARGKFTLPQLVDVALRHFIAHGEVTGVLDWWRPTLRRRYRVETGTKLCLFAPHRLMRATSEFEGLHGGVFHDENGRPVAYRVKEKVDGLDVERDLPAFDGDGRPLFVHLFDPWDAADTRGMSVLAAALRTHVQAETLSEATLATAVLQTVFAAVLTSPAPSIDAFQAIEEVAGLDEDLKEDFLGFFGAKLDRAREGGLYIDGSPRVSHLGPGEDLAFRTAGTPGSNYIPFSADLRREIARCIGVTYEALSLDHSDATYSSVRMSNAAIWPVVLRRRERIAAPLCQAVYENWLDDEIGEGRIPLRGGYAAFRANRQAIVWAEWQGPAKPSADDEKSAKAATERLQNGTTTLAYECAEFGLAVEDVVATRAAELKLITAAGLPSPFERTKGGGDPAAKPAPTSV